MAISGDTEPLPRVRPGALYGGPTPWPGQGGSTTITPPTTANRPALARPRRSVRREIGKWLTSLAILVALAVPLLGASLVGAIYWQARTDETRRVEAIVVLGTAQFNGRPGPVLRARLDRALALYQDGYAPLIVVTGGKQQGDAFTEAEAGHAYLTERGVPATAILLEAEGSDSWESMQAVDALLAARSLSRVLLVSDGFHLFRLKKMAHDLGLTAFAAPVRDSPIRPGGPTELSYVVREAGGLLVYLWQT